MSNSFDAEGRGPTNVRLFMAGVAFMLILFAIAALLIAKYQGRLDPVVRVSAELVNVGDGLPARSDVKFRGVLVGFVSDVVPAVQSRPNVVRIDLKPRYASGIPNTVTARVVPSNVFAVSSVQLVDNGNGSAPLGAGAVIHEDQSLPTVLFQTTLNKFREVLAAIGREPSTAGIGWLTALGEATEGRGDRLEDAGQDLNAIVRQLNTVVGTEPGPSTMSALTAAADGLREAAPDLFDALAGAVKPMRTLAEKRSALAELLSAGLGSAGLMGQAFENHTDRLINITTELTPMVGLLADHDERLHTITTRMTNNIRAFGEVAWNPETKALNIKGVFGLTPTRTYVRADCPRYGELLGPSCFTAPEVPVAPALTPALGSRGLPLPPGVSENRPNFAPPRDSVEHVDGELEQPPLPGPEAPLLPAEAPPPPEPAGPIEPMPSPEPGSVSGVQPQSAVFGGNVGPVGSSQEKDQLTRIVGSDATAATEFLLGPLARGATVYLDPAAGGDR